MLPLHRFHFLRGFINTLCSRRLDALCDFQNLYKTDTAIVPMRLVTWLVNSLHKDERHQADKRPELKRLILKVGCVTQASGPTLGKRSESELSFDGHCFFCCSSCLSDLLYKIPYC